MPSVLAACRWEMPLSCRRSERVRAKSGLVIRIVPFPSVASNIDVVIRKRLLGPRTHEHADDVLELPAVPFGLEVSPEGTRFAVVYAYEAAVYQMGEREPMTVCRVQESTQSDCLFIDEDTVIYTGEKAVEAYSNTSG